MANKDLQGNSWKIPKKYIIHLKSKLDNYKGDKHTEGYTRLNNLITSGEISYENLKNVKHILEKNISDEVLYNLNGGKHFHAWVNSQLKVARDRLESTKKVKKESGVENAYIKHHNKDSTNKGRIRNPKLEKSMSSNDIYNNNVNYESTRNVKLVITEQQFKTLIKENDELNHQLQGLRDYLKSGDKDNIELAFIIAESLGISEDVLLEPFKELFEFLKKYNKHKKISYEILNKEAFLEMTNLESLSLPNNQLTDLPAVVASFTNLKYLYLENNNLTELPASVASLTNLERLNLDNNNLTDLPASVASLTNLEHLYLRNNQLTDLPVVVALLTNLERLDLENNNLTDLPASVASLTNLEVLYLTNNNLTDLPASVASLTKLKHLYLENNKLTKQEQNRIESLLPNCSCHF